MNTQPSRRPQQISEDIWYDMSEEEKVEALRKYNPSALEDTLDDEEEYQPSRRPQQISEDVWYDMSEEEKVEALRKYNPSALEDTLDDEEEYQPSRRPQQISEDVWYDMTEEEKVDALRLYNPDALEPSERNSIKQYPSHAPSTSTSTTNSKPYIEDKNEEKKELTKEKKYVEVTKITPKTKQDDIEYDYESKFRDEDDNKTSKYKLANLINFFAKHNIKLKSIFTEKRRIKFVLIQVSLFNLCVYMPSKYEMYMEKPIGIATYELQIDDEDDDVDTLFYNRLPIEEMRRKKKSKSKSMQRFMPLMTDSNIKTMYLDEYFIVYIDRDNEIESYLMNNPCQSQGYYYLTDLQYLFKNINRMHEELSRFERVFNDAVYDRLSSEVEQTKQNLDKMVKKVQKINPLMEKKIYNTKQEKIAKYLKKDKYKDKAKALMMKIRQDNLNNMFNIENITYVMKEFK